MVAVVAPLRHPPRSSTTLLTIAEKANLDVVHAFAKKFPTLLCDERALRFNIKLRRVAQTRRLAAENKALDVLSDLSESEDEAAREPPRTFDDICDRTNKFYHMVSQTRRKRGYQGGTHDDFHRAPIRAHTQPPAPREQQQQAAVVESNNKDKQATRHNCHDDDRKKHRSRDNSRERDNHRDRRHKDDRRKEDRHRSRSRSRDRHSKDKREKGHDRKSKRERRKEKKRDRDDRDKDDGRHEPERHRSHSSEANNNSSSRGRDPARLYGGGQHPVLIPAQQQPRSTPMYMHPQQPLMMPMMLVPVQPQYAAQEQQTDIRRLPRYQVPRSAQQEQQQHHHHDKRSRSGSSHNDRHGNTPVMTPRLRKYGDRPTNPGGDAAVMESTNSNTNTTTEESTGKPKKLIEF